MTTTHPFKIEAGPDGAITVTLPALTERQQALAWWLDRIQTVEEAEALLHGELLQRIGPLPATAQAALDATRQLCDDLAAISTARDFIMAGGRPAGRMEAPTR